jgi:SAM-dependent methyltransferase
MRHRHAVDERLLAQQRRYDRSWRRGLDRGKEQRGNLEAHLAFLEHSGALTTPCRTLEVGCGIGTVVAELTRRGHDAVGIDLPETAITHGLAKYGSIRLEVHAAERLPYPDRCFEVVLSLDVLEHIHGVEEHLDEVRRVLVPGGRCLIATPAKQFAVVLETVSQRSLRWRRDHPSLHTPGQLRRRLRDHGFEVRFVRVNPVTDFVLAKLPRWLAPAVQRLDVSRLPLSLQPTLFVVATRR